MDKISFLVAISRPFFALLLQFKKMQDVVKDSIGANGFCHNQLTRVGFWDNSRVMVTCAWKSPFPVQFPEKTGQVLPNLSFAS